MKRNQSDHCPQCGQGRLYFSGDGRARICERCGFRVDIKKPDRTLAKLKEDTRLLPIQSTSEYRQGQANSMRMSLVRGIGAVKAGDMDEAYFCLTRILRHSRDEEDRANAWLWLSQVVSKPEERRLCLEEILAIKPTHQLAARGLAVLDGRLNPADIIDPDQYLQEISDSPLTAEAEQFTCPRCDGRMNYAADGRVLRCEFCTFQQEVDESGQLQPKVTFGQGEFEQEFTLALATAKGHIQPANVRTFQCHNCAVDFVLAPQTISVTCPYCDGVYVTETAESDEIIPPHALIPFSIEYNQAEMALRRWFKKHKIERPPVSPIVGIYLPVWTFDVGGEVKWSGLVEEGDSWVPDSDELSPASRQPHYRILQTNFAADVGDSLSGRGPRL